MSGENTYIRNIGVMGAGMRKAKANAPTEYNTRKKQYFSDETSAFVSEKAKYASDFVSAEVQGLNPTSRTQWQTELVRMSDIVKTSAAMTKRIDDYKEVLFANRGIDYVPPGAKLVSMGSTWLCVNPSNISSAVGNAIFQRCQSTWNSLDFYGNVVREPICIEQSVANASTPDDQDQIRISTGSYTIRCQHNERTRQLDNNSRIAIGNRYMMITGFTDFIHEFTEDDNSTRLVEFTARFEEPNKELDDLDNHVAGGKSFSWEIEVHGNATMRTGTTTTLTASSVRNGETVTATTEHPISYIWESSDEAVATVNANGVVTALSAGECVITCKLAQNEQKLATATITATESGTGTSVAFTSTPDTKIRAYETATYTAVVYENGIEQEGRTVAWTFMGADASCYKTVINGNTASVTCYCGSDTPLTVKASYGTENASVSVSLMGM